MKLSPTEIIGFKNREKLAMLTCYDAMTASVLESAGIDLILVGDSCANVFLGESSTRNTDIRKMAYHVRAVRNGNPTTHIIGDLDFNSCKTVRRAVKSATCLLRSGADSVKLEGWQPLICRAFRKRGIPFVGHVGLLPQTARRFTVRGKECAEADWILHSALQLEAEGAFLIVAECVPKALAIQMQQACRIPIIGIGAGSEVDGQVLVINDMLGFSEKVPKFVRKFADLHSAIETAVKSYISEVKGSQFPNERETFH